MTAATTSSSSGTATLKTLVITDLVDSTLLVERLGDARAAELSARHDRMARALVERHEGREIDKTDGFLLLFERPLLAVAFALAYHEALARFAAEEGVFLEARVGIHVGEVFLRENPPAEVAQGAKPIEVEGLAKPLAARLMALARGGQTLLTRSAFDLARRAAAGAAGFGESLRWLAHGGYAFKGIDEAIEVYEVGVEGRAPLLPPSGSEKARRLGSDDTVLGWRPAPGQTVPLRPNWEFEKKLGEGGFGEVWLARQRKTREPRVFKFCFDLERARGLQREVTVCRLLRETLGNRPDIARILDWNFEEPPYFLEFEYTEGGNLVEWVEAQGGFSSVAMSRRLELAAQAAEAVAAAHSVGVLHKDIKPANILVTTDPDGSPRARVTDFGIGLVTDSTRLADLGITQLGMTETPATAGGTRPSGTRIYMAPEVLESKPATIQADIYSLGVLVYQMAVGDFARSLAPGWERDVDDEILREDVAAFVDGRPERRVASAIEVARRLRALDRRRAERQAERIAAERAEADRRALETARRRRRIAAVIAAVGVLFAAGMGLQARRVAQEAERANREAAAAARVTEFLIDLFKVSNPSESTGSAVTARELLDRGAERLDSELADQPVLRARMLDAIGTVYVQLGLYDSGGRLLDDALALRRRELGDTAPETLDSRADLANLAELRGELETAERAYREAFAALEANGLDATPTAVKVRSGLANVLAEGARYDDAVAESERAIALAVRVHGERASEVARALTPLAYVHFKTGRYREAADVLRRVLAIEEALHGADSKPVADALNNLAVQLREIGDLEEARALYERSLAIQERVLPPNHPDLASLFNNLAHIWQDRDEPAKAEPWFAKALDVRLAALGERHPQTALSLNNLGYCLWMLDRRDEAEALWRRALAAREAIYGPDHPEVAVTLTNLGLLDLARGRVAEARRTLERALAMYERALGSDQPPMLGVLLAAAEAARAAGDEASAAGFDERVTAIRTTAASRGERLPPAPVIRRP